MNKIFLILLVTLINPIFAFASGEYWNNLDIQSKTAYVVGFRDGNANGLGLAKFVFDNKTEKENDALEIQNERQRVISGNINTVVSGVDKFYSDYANQRIPIPVAIATVVSRLSGESELEIQAYVEGHRKEFNAP